MYLFVNELEMMVKCDVKGENDKGGCVVNKLTYVVVIFFDLYLHWQEDVVNKLTYVVVIFFDLYLHWQEDVVNKLTYVVVILGTME
jgi:hypothetical protein